MSISLVIPFKTTSTLFFFYPPNLFFSFLSFPFCVYLPPDSRILNRLSWKMITNPPISFPFFPRFPPPPDLSEPCVCQPTLLNLLMTPFRNNVRHCKSIYSAPFYVYTAKKFPGMEGTIPFLSLSLLFSLPPLGLPPISRSRFSRL